jgi:hypothetical protein
LGGSALNMAAKKTYAQVISDFETIHGNRYTYDEETFSGTQRIMRISCAEHGEFWQTPASHRSGSGCPTCGKTKCRKNRILPFDEILEKFTRKFGTKFKYFADTYAGRDKKMNMECPDHGIIRISPAHHLESPTGCKKCSHSAMGQRYAHDAKDFLTLTSVFPEGQFSYDISTYVNMATIMTITCKDHGEFQATPNNHLRRLGCKKCSAERKGIFKTNDVSDVYSKALDKHGDLYQYHPETIFRQKDQMKVTCREHGDFFTTPDSHVRGGHGCPKCMTSTQEMEVYDFLTEMGLKVEHGRRDLLGTRQELDLYMPDVNTAVEFTGLYWHSIDKKSHDHLVKKWEKCRELGIHLVTLFSDEWELRRNAVEDTLRTLCGHRPTGLGARHFLVDSVSSSEAAKFCDKHHLQGSAAQSHAYGLRDTSGNLVACMTFSSPSRPSNHPFELRRFVTDSKTHSGAASRLFKAHILDHPNASVVSMSDRRWFSGAMYSLLGFTHDGVVRPDYFYTKGSKRYNKSSFRRSGIMTKFPDIYSPEKSEHQMMLEAGFSRIYDCGKDRWVWKPH